MTERESARVSLITRKRQIEIEEAKRESERERE